MFLTAEKFGKNSHLNITVFHLHEFAFPCDKTSITQNLNF